MINIEGTIYNKSSMHCEYTYKYMHMSYVCNNCVTKYVYICVYIYICVYKDIFIYVEDHNIIASQKYCKISLSES